MSQFDYSELADRTWGNEIISYIPKIHEYKGKQEYILRSEAGEASINFARLIKKRMTSSIRLAPWSRAKERYKRMYNDDKGNIK
jgi:hypothetical protein